MKNIVIKPHHLLDILKLYGKGIENFVPDSNYEHDFYIIANMVVSGGVQFIRFTRNCDDICRPCKYCKTEKCSDVVAFLDGYSKDQYNKEIDDKLLEILGLSFDTNYSFDYILMLLSRELNYHLFKKVWKQEKEDAIRFRNAFTIMGTYKVLMQLEL
jgi:hypothetical protein